MGPLVAAAVSGVASALAGSAMSKKDFGNRIEEIFGTEGKVKEVPEHKGPEKFSERMDDLFKDK